MELTGVDLHYLAREMQGFLDGKIEQIVQGTEKRDLLMRVYVKDRPKVHLRILPPGLICTHAEKPGHYPKVPPGFAMFLRKYLKNTRISRIAQRGFDRILEIDLQHREETFTMVIELLAPGNVLVLSDGKIKGILETQNFKDRTLRGGIEYIAPPATFDPRAASGDEIAAAIEKSEKNSIVTTLAMDLGLGGIYAEEACARAEVDKTAASLDAEGTKRIVTAIGELFSQDIAPHKDEKRTYPFAMRSRAGVPARTPSFLAALGQGLDVVPEKKEVAKKERKDKLETMRKAQEKSMDRLEQQSRESQLIGERIYVEYQVLQQILFDAHKAQEEKGDVLAALKGYPQVKGYDPKSKEIAIELPE